jgi:hypothetical protein
MAESMAKFKASQETEIRALFDGDLGYKSRSKSFRLEIPPHRFNDIADIVSSHIGICSPTHATISYAFGAVEFTVYSILNSLKRRMSDYAPA